MIVKVVIPDALYNRVYFARGEQGPQGATGPQGSPGATGATGPQGPAGANGTSYVPGDPIYVTVRNSTGSPLLKGSIVYVSGSNGNHVQVSLAQAIGDITSARTIGWVADTIPNNTEGLIMVEGYLEGLNTQGITAGAQLYLSPTVPGGFTSTKPVAPDHMVYVGVAVKISAGDGHVYVKVQNGYELDELHSVKITNPVNNQVLTYDSATDLWVNATNPADGVTSITASSPLTGGTITSTGSIGLDQSLLTVTQSQVTGLVSALAGKASTTHASTHASGGTDAITIAQSQVTGLVAELANDAKLNAANTFSVGGHVIANSSVAVVPLVLRGTSGQTGDLLQIQNSASQNFLTINNLGSVLFGSSSGSFLSGANGRVNIQLSDATAVGLSIRTAPSQTAGFMELRDSANNLQTIITPGASIRTAGNLVAGNANTALGQLTSFAGSASTIGAVVRGAASQTANLQEWQNSAGTVRARVDSSGNVFGVTYGGINQFVFVREELSGGSFEAKKLTAAAANPGANNGKLYFRDGTNAGTLRLCVRAGAAGAETTILDNIPQ